MVTWPTFFGPEMKQEHHRREHVVEKIKKAAQLMEARKQIK
jgi:hypothetical protein